MKFGTARSDGLRASLSGQPSGFLFLRDDADIATGFQDGDLDLIEPLDLMWRARRLKNVVYAHARPSPRLFVKLAHAHQDGRRAVDHPGGARRPLPEVGEGNVYREERQYKDERVHEREIVAQQRLLGRFGDDEKQDQIEGGNLCERAAAGQAYDNQQDDIDDNTADDGFHVFLQISGQYCRGYMLIVAVQADREGGEPRMQRPDIDDDRSVSIGIGCKGHLHAFGSRFLAFRRRLYPLDLEG